MFKKQQTKNTAFQKKVENFLNNQLAGLEKGRMKAFDGLTVSAVDFDTEVEGTIKKGYVNTVKCSVYMKHMPNVPFAISTVSVPADVHDMEVCKALALSQALHKRNSKVDLNENAQVAV